MEAYAVPHYSSSVAVVVVVDMPVGRYLTVVATVAPLNCSVDSETVAVAAAVDVTAAVVDLQAAVASSLPTDDRTTLDALAVDWKIAAVVVAVVVVVVAVVVVVVVVAAAEDCYSCFHSFG